MQRIANGIYRLTYGTPENHTPVAILRPSTRYEALDSLADHPLPFPEESVDVSITPRGVLIELPLESGEDVYGLGLQLKSFRQTGKKKLLRTNSDPTSDTGDSHAPVPFYVSSKGYGVLVDTARYASFYCGNLKKVGSDRDKAGIPSNDDNNCWWQILDGVGNMNIEVPRTKGIDIYIFCGDGMADAVSRYNLFCGGGALVPIWGLGMLYRGYMRGNQSDMIALAEEIRKDRIPCDIFGLEPGWQTHAYSCTHEWDRGRYPDPTGFANQLADNGFRLNLWEHAYVHPDSPIHESIKPYSGNYYVWDGCIPDFSLPAAQEIFAGNQERLIDGGVTGFKLDECDNSDFTSNWGFPDFTDFPSGIDGEQMHSIFGLLYQKTMLNPYLKRNTRTIGQVRQSGACASPYPYVLYSDLYDHADFVRGLGSAAFSGLLWSPEVRQADSEEELLRRIAAVISSPQALMNCYMIPSPPWKQFDLNKNLAGDLLADNGELTAKCRRLFELRMSLVPHFYTAFCKYHTEGLPPVRPLIMDYPDDPGVRDIWDEYIIGDGLLAAPVIFGSGSGRNIYLPSGIWYDFYTGERISGGSTFYTEVPTDKLPLFVRDGTLLAVAAPLQYIADDAVFDITLRAYGNAESCRLYTDDGVTYNALADGLPFVTATPRKIPDNRRYRLAGCEEYK